MKVMLARTSKRPHYVPLNKKISDTISINIRDQAGDLVAFEHCKVIIITLISDAATYSISFEIILPLTRLDQMGYDNMPDNAWEDYYYAQAFPEESFLQLLRGGNVSFCHEPVLQRGYGLGSIFKSVVRGVMLSLKEIGKSALITGLEVFHDVAKGENIKTSAKKRLRENSLAFLDDAVARMTPRKSIKEARISKSQSVHQNLRNVNISLESLTTLYFQS